MNPVANILLKHEQTTVFWMLSPVGIIMFSACAMAFSKTLARRLIWLTVQSCGSAGRKRYVADTEQPGDDQRAGAEHLQRSAGVHPGRRPFDLCLWGGSPDTVWAAHLVCSDCGGYGIRHFSSLVSGEGFWETEGEPGDKRPCRMNLCMLISIPRLGAFLNLDFGAAKSLWKHGWNTIKRGV
jgi:hypothetical protein